MLAGLMLCASWSSASWAASDGEVTTVDGPAIELSVTPVVGDGPDDGDLVPVDGHPDLFALLFSSSTAFEQQAVYELRVSNVGDAPLRDVAVSHERMGIVLEAAEGRTIEPGEELILRGAMSFTFTEVATTLGGLHESTATASATLDDGTDVRDSTDIVLELVAVLSTPSLDVVVEVVPSEGGDVTVGEPPTLQWTDAQLEAGERRVAPHRVTVTNSNDVEVAQVVVETDHAEEPLVSLEDGIVLAPGESIVLEFDRVVEASEAVAADLAGLGAADLVTTVTATGVDSVQEQTALGRDQTVLRALLVADEPDDAAVLAATLPAAGSNRGVLLGVPALLFIVGGLAMLAAGRPGRRRA